MALAKGQEAKSRVIEKIKAAFGSDFIGEIDRKIYIWSMEKGEPKQVALSLTCPSVPVGEYKKVLDFGAADGGIDFEAAATIPVVKPADAEISKEELDNIEELMARLGL